MNEFDYMKTSLIRDEILRCEDLEDLKENIFPMLRSQRDEWERKINEMIRWKSYSKTKFAKLCGVSRVTVDKWCKGSLPKNRETFLKIGMAAGCGIAEMNQLLQRYGRYPALYSKSLEDCVCIYVISRDYGEEAVARYQYILDRIKARIIRGGRAEEIDVVSTNTFDARLSGIRNEDELERFVVDNAAQFANSYHRFYACVKMFIDANYMQVTGARTYFQMANEQSWSSSLRQCVSAIRQNKWYPTRNKIISLGLHLSMDREGIDEMLELAHMEPLCAKNIFESVIIFILEDASLNDKLDRRQEQYDPDDLCMYAREILSELDLPEMEAFISELPEEDDDAW